MRQISCVNLGINVEEIEPLEMKETERIDINFQQLHCHHFVSFLCAIAIYFVALILSTYSNSCLTNQTQASLNWAWHIEYSHYLLTIRKWHDYWFMTANKQRIQNMCVCGFLFSHRPISWCPSIFSNLFKHPNKFISVACQFEDDIVRLQSIKSNKFEPSYNCLFFLSPS